MSPKAHAIKAMGRGWIECVCGRWKYQAPEEAMEWRTVTLEDHLLDFHAVHARAKADRAES